MTLCPSSGYRRSATLLLADQPRRRARRGGRGAVLAGALLVGDSVRGSLRDIALGRLGHDRSGAVVDRLLSRRAGRRPAQALGRAAAAPLIVADGVRDARGVRPPRGDVIVYGVDERFWTFHGLPAAGRRRRLTGAGRRARRQGRRRAADAAAEAVRDPDRIAVRPQGRHRPHRAADARRRPAARAARRVLAASRSRRRCAPCSRRCGASSAISRVPGQVNTVLLVAGATAASDRRSVAR